MRRALPTEASWLPGLLWRSWPPGRTGSWTPWLLAALLACGGSGGRTAELAGTWRAVLHSPGGDLPFALRIARPGAAIPAVALNGPEEVPFTSVSLDGDHVRLRIDGYDSEIVARLESGDGRPVGTWSKAVLGGTSSLPFEAVRGDPERFRAPTEREKADAHPEALASVDGAWRVTCTDEDGDEPARAEFQQEGSRVTGTFLTPVGDYRFLEGDYREGLLRLSCFDGGDAYLFQARARNDGTLEGDFWSRDRYHATWTARRLEDGGTDELPDPFELAGLTNDEGKFSFRFSDLDGRPRSLADARFRGKVVLVNLFGSWCPNCNDEAPLLASWYRRYRDRGLEVVGLAYEVSGDPVRDAAFVRRFAERHGVEYPLLLAGVSDKDLASRTLPDLTQVVAFPTTIFVGRDGRVRRIHTGFHGPGAGSHHDRLVAEFGGFIERFLLEPPAADAKAAR